MQCMGHSQRLNPQRFWCFPCLMDRSLLETGQRVAFVLFRYPCGTGFGTGFGGGKFSIFKCNDLNLSHVSDNDDGPELRRAKAYTMPVFVSRPI
jgi:hypothetical protein